MLDYIDGLFELCKAQPFDIEKIERFIAENNMSNEEVTRSALKLCDYGAFSYSDYVYEYNIEPVPCNLRTCNWELLFNVLLDNGLDAGLVIHDENGNSENILSSIRYFDDGDLGARVLSNILSNGISPNVAIDGISFFEHVDGDLITDIDMGLYPHKWQLDNAFRFCLVLVGYGGVLKGGRSPVDMCNGFSPEIFKEFDSFDYDLSDACGDFKFGIIEKKTNTLVATVRDFEEVE